jgi:EmrB/QacA subfamily drug resistance transporter
MLTGETPSTLNPHHARRWLILGLLGMAQLMVVLDATIVNIALPSAQDALGFSDDDRQWVITAYALGFGSLLLLGGRLSDLFGQKRMFITGAAGFAIASAIGGMAQNFEVLVAARAVQGMFGALLAPAALSLVTTTFTDPAERGKAFGIYGAIAGGGGAIGLLLGGILTEYTSWRWSLYVNLAFAVPAGLAALALLRNTPREGRTHIDVPGVLTATSGLFALVYGFSKAQTSGWGASVTLGFLAAGVVALMAFVAIERRVEHPLLPLRVVLDRNRGGSYLAVALSGAGIFGVFLFLTYYLQDTLGFSPVSTGLAFLPMTGMLMLGAGVSSSRLLPRIGPKPILAMGMVLSAAGMLYLTGVKVDSGYAEAVLPGLIILGLGMGFTMATAMGTSTLGVRPEDAGVASAMVNTGQQIGGSIGTALLSTFASTAVTDYASSHAPAADLAARASVHGYTTAFLISGGIFLAGAIVSGGLLRRGVPVVDGAAAPVMAH